MSKTMSNPQVMGWNDTLNMDENEDQQYIKLEPGKYVFVVKEFHRTEYKGSAKIPACPCAEMVLAIGTVKGTATAKINFPLCSTVAWKIAAFFRSIGMKKRGEDFVMDFPGAVGKSGIAEFYARPWSSDPTKFSNDVKAFDDYDPQKIADMTAALQLALHPPMAVEDAKLPWE